MPSQMSTICRTVVVICFASNLRSTLLDLEELERRLEDLGGVARERASREMEEMRSWRSSIISCV
jgi:hypothetical protein